MKSASKQNKTKPKLQLKKPKYKRKKTEKHIEMTNRPADHISNDHFEN